MKQILVLAILAISTPVLAQQPVTLTEQALGGKLMKEINESLRCDAEVLQLKVDLAKANERIKALESPPKEEPKKD